MRALHQLSALLFSSVCLIIIQCTKEGAYIPFSLSKFTTIKSTINSYLTALKLLNASAIKGRELICSRSITMYKYASLHQLINVCRNKYQGEIQKKSLLACPVVFPFSMRWLA